MSIDFAIKPVSPSTPGHNADGAAVEQKKTEARVEAKKDIHPKKVDRAATEVQILLKRLNTELRLEVKKDSRDVVVKIVDPDTQTVIRQIPSEEILSIRERMTELIGVLFKTET
ncbi:MAG: flagellar protein FlaG [Deltaproteobacteria bacterium]|nr:flagellar protein FlaG [Deltaproteobacteria bacterium]